MLDVTERLHQLMDPLRLYYYAFLTEAEQSKHRTVVEGLISKHGVSTEAAARIQVIQLNQAKQARSATSDDRKDRLLTALFQDFTKFTPMLGLYRGLIAKLQGYTKLFQCEKPLVHMYHAEMFQLVRKVLLLFMKKKHVPEISLKSLMKMKDNINSRDQQKNDELLCVGQYSFVPFTDALKDPKNRHWAKELADNLRKGYVQCATMLLNKLPLTNKTITSLSCLHPEAFAGDDEDDDDNFLKHSCRLGKSLPNVVPENDLGVLDSEVREFYADRQIVALAKAFDNSRDRIDVDFWSKVFQTEKYPVLSRLVKALLTIFTGPLVEGTFNLMDDIIRPDRSKLLTENYEAVAVIKSHLKSLKVKATTMTVTPEMVRFVNTSKGRYVRSMEERKARKRQTQNEKNLKAVEQLSASKNRKKTIRCTPMPAAKRVRSSESVSVTRAPSATVTAPNSSELLESCMQSAVSTSCDSTENSPAVGGYSSNSKASVKTMPKGGKRVALKGTLDLRSYFKQPRLDLNKE
ncbi:hypothetical protein ACOMHN_037476 [Nucella lapillus]